MIGQLISHYKILEKLGEGGMGVVYKAEDTKLKRTVALKFLPAKTLASEAEKTRFIHEAQAAAALNHPNICTIYEIDEFEGQPFIVMEFVEGLSLKEKVSSGQFSVNTVIDFGIQIAEGLQAAHEKGIIHRDMKCDNVMVNAKSVAKIMDFGLAKLSGRTQVTQEGTTLGTISYMSPEQARGEKVDQRTDIWSFGVMLYEMLTGQLPFRGEYEQAVIYSVMNEEPEPPTALRSGVPMELERIVLKALAKESDERYQYMEELLVDLRRLKKEQTLKKAHTQTARSTKIKEKKAVSMILPGIILGALILAVAGYFFFAPGKRKADVERKMLVVLPFENLGATEEQYFADGVTEEITSRLALVSGLGVISRTSAYQYAKTEKTIKQIGEELGVEFVLEGTIRWAPSPAGSDRVRITPQLIRTRDDTHLWANSYDHVIDDIFEIQTEIAQMVVQQLGVTLLEPERRAVEVRPTENLEAYQAYLRGRYYEGRPHFLLENWKRVVQNYQRAVALDAGFALAWAELSKAHARFYFFQVDLSEARLKMAKDAAGRALELAPESPKVHLVLSYYYLWAFRNPERALAELEIAENGLPNNAEILQAKAAIYELQGRWDEALDLIESAYELSPRDASLPTEIAWIFWTTRRYPQAIDACNQAIALAPDAAWPYLYKAFTYWFWKAAIDEARPALEAMPKNHSWAPWAWFWQLVYEGRYREALDDLSSTSGKWIRLKAWARPKPLLSAYVYELLNEPQLARAAYNSASKLLEAEVRSWPDDPRYHSSLGVAYAALGRQDAAIREGKRAVELLPVSRDAFYGLPYVQDLAHIYTLVGEYDAALDQIEYLLSIPSWFSVPWLRIDPRWNRLRDHHRFKLLLEKYLGDNL